MNKASNPIRFYLLERHIVDPRDPKNKEKQRKVFQARIASRGRVKFRDFCGRVARGASFTQQEVEAVINYATEIAREIVANGDIVEFGDLGTMSPSFVSKVVTQIEDFNVLKHISRPKVCFRPSRDFFDLRTYPGVSFQRMDASTPQRKGRKTPAPKTPKPKDGGSGDAASGDGPHGI